MRHLLLPSAWIAGVLVAAYGSSLGNPLLINRGIPLNEQGRPWVALVFVAAVTIECLLVWAVLRPRTYRRSWVRALIALLVLLTFLFYVALTAMHGPTALFFHVYWLLAFSAGVLALFLLSVTTSIFNWSRSRVA